MNISKTIVMNPLKSNTMIISKIVKTTGLLTTSIFFMACSSDDDTIPKIINPEEVITTMELTLVPENGGATLTLNYQDLDGSGPNEPTIESDILTKNTAYQGSIVLLNETVDPAENITLEVEEEDVDHQFFFSNTADLTVTYADEDANGNPVGIEFTLETSATTSGSLTITLRHEPNKTAEGVNNGNIENAGGETDISVTFPITVE